MTPTVQQPSPTRKLTARRIALAAVALAALAAGIAGIVKMNQHDEQVRNKQRAGKDYQEGVKLLQNAQWAEAIVAFDKALATADLTKARTMKAATLMWFQGAAPAFAAYDRAPEPVKSAYRTTVSTPAEEERSESTLRKELQILDAALAIDPGIKEFWYLKGDVLLSLVSVNPQNYPDRNAATATIRKCYEQANGLDPSWDVARNRLAEPWLQPQPTSSPAK